MQFQHLIWFYFLIVDDNVWFQPSTLLCAYVVLGFFFFFSLILYIYFLFLRDLNVSEFAIFCGSVSYDIHCTGTKALWWLNITSCLIDVQQWISGTALQNWLHMFGLPVSPIHKHHVWILILKGVIVGLRLDQICSVLLLLFYLFMILVCSVPVLHATKGVPIELLGVLIKPFLFVNWVFFFLNH